MIFISCNPLLDVISQDLPNMQNQGKAKTRKKGHEACNGEEIVLPTGCHLQGRLRRTVSVCVVLNEIPTM